MTTYYMGVYKRRVFQRSCRVFQVSDRFGRLSCELLAEPKMLTIDYAGVQHMISSSKEFARLAACSYLEINCSKGKGSYRWHRITDNACKEV